MSMWKECLLSDLGTIVGGATPSTKNPSNYEGGTIPWITPKDLSTFSGRYISRGERMITKMGLDSCSTQLMPKNSVLFSSRAPIGYVAIANNELCTNQGFKSIVPNDKTDYLFLYYLLKFKKGDIEHLGSGTTFKEVSGATMRGVKVRVPTEIEDQRKIATILGALDDKIELNNRINENLELQAQTLFKSWFIDFDPYGGVCPASWKQGTLADIASITSGKRPLVKSAERTDTAVIPLVGAAAVMGYTTEANHCEKILVTGRVGTHGVVQRFNSPCWTSDNTLVITSDFYEYTYQILQRIDYPSMNRGSTQPLITQGDMNKVKTLIPDQATISAFEIIAGQLMQKNEANHKENEHLATMRDTLLPMLMTGMIDLSSIEI